MLTPPEDPIINLRQLQVGGGVEELWTWSESTCHSCHSDSLGPKLQSLRTLDRPVMPAHSLALLREMPMVHGPPIQVGMLRIT